MSLYEVHRRLYIFLVVDREKMLETRVPLENLAINGPCVAAFHFYSMKEPGKAVDQPISADGFLIRREPTTSGTTAWAAPGPQRKGS